MSCPCDNPKCPSCETVRRIKHYLSLHYEEKDKLKEKAELEHLRIKRHYYEQKGNT